MYFSFQSVLLQSGCGHPSVWIGSVLATKKNVAGKPYRSRMGTACSNWHRSPSSKVRETSAGLSIVLPRLYSTCLRGEASSWVRFLRIGVQGKGLAANTALVLLRKEIIPNL